jgi:transposase
MHPNRSQRRVHSAEFKAQVLAECRQPGASVASVAIAHGLNPNVVRKWLVGRNLKRMGAALPTPAPCAAPVLQFVPVELAKPDHCMAATPAVQPDIRIDVERGDLRLKLQCAASAGPSYAALLRALADAVAVA